MSRNVPFTGNCLKITDSLYIPENYRRASFAPPPFLNYH
jgi:hypothetical protein